MIDQLIRAKFREGFLIITKKSKPILLMDFDGFGLRRIADEGIEDILKNFEIDLNFVDKIESLGNYDFYFEEG